jgi:hypothetical protein
MEGSHQQLETAGDCISALREVIQSRSGSGCGFLRRRKSAGQIVNLRRQNRYGGTNTTLKVIEARQSPRQNKTVEAYAQSAGHQQYVSYHFHLPAPSIENEFHDQQVSDPTLTRHQLDPAKHLRAKPGQGRWVFEITCLKRAKIAVENIHHARPEHFNVVDMVSLNLDLRCEAQMPVSRSRSERNHHRIKRHKSDLWQRINWLLRFFLG